MPGSGLHLGREHLKGDSANIFPERELQGPFSSRVKAWKGLAEVERALGQSFFLRLLC